MAMKGIVTERTLYGKNLMYMACFLVLEEMRELNKCDRFVVCGVFGLCVDQVDS